MRTENQSTRIDGLIRMGGIGALLSVLLLPAFAFAQAEVDQVMVVPYSQRNTQLPHPAHESAQITLKAIVRNASCATYHVWWDVNQNGNYDDDFQRVVSPEGGAAGESRSVRDIGRTFLVPAVNGDTAMNINVRVRNTCNAQEKFGSMRLFVYDWTPSNDPVAWTDDQIGIMSQMAIQETLWFLHRGLGGFVGRDVSTIRAHYSACGAAAGCRETGALMVWMMAINSHLPAYPPGTINTFDQALPDGWVEENNRRWNQDPYAEDVIRLVNDAINMGTGFRGVAAEDEDLRCRYAADGVTQVNCNRIAGTDDRRGVWLGAGSGSVYRMGIYLGGISTILPALGGTPVQNGVAGIQGQKWEWLIQQATDYLGLMQVDGGTQSGAWCYRERGCNANVADANPVYNYDSNDTWDGDGSTMQWAYIGLESAAVAGESFSVYVPNRIKYRIANALVSNQRGDGGSAYRTAEVGSNFQLTGGAFVAARWLGVHTMPAGAQVAFPGWSNHSRDTLRNSYARYLSYTSQQWGSTQRRGSHGWVDGNWSNGDYLCGNRNGVYPLARCGNMYSIYSHQKGYRTGSPELTTQDLGHDWVRQFSVYAMRAQDRRMSVADPMANYGTFGETRDDYCVAHATSVTCSYAPGHLSSGMAGMVSTPTIFTPKPVAIGTAQPREVTAGCAGGNNGQVTFDHSQSFHPSPSSRILTWQWDVDSRNGLWWATNANPDFNTAGANPLPTFQYTYLQAGDYTATLRVVDTIGLISLITIPIRVNPAANVPPSAAHGGPYIVEVGANLQLRGNANDQNLGCSDRITVGWDLNNDGAFGEAAAANQLVNWDIIRNLAVGQAHRIRIRVTDSFNAVTTAETTLTIVPAEPVADARANPNPVGCNVPVTFDGTASFHPNPARSIAQYIWDVNNDGQADSGQARYVHNFPGFGTYRATLTVVDDLNRRGTDTVDVVVNQGNNNPVARVSLANYVVLEGDPLPLDGRLSSEPDVGCGDSIVRYEWDVNGNNAYGDAIDQQGVQPVVQWAGLAQAVGWPQNARNGSLVVNARMRVIDEFNAEGVVQFTITIQAGRPVAVLEQRPNPAPINLVTGVSNPTLDARGSTSPIAGVVVNRWDWDLDDDGIFEVQNRASVDLPRVFLPVPGPNNIPAVFVRLQVYDQAGRVSNPLRYQVRYDVPPTSPTADADPNDPPEPGYHMLVGDNLTLDGSDSFDPDAQDFGDLLIAYRWDLNFNGNFNHDVRTLSPAAGQPAPPNLQVTWNQLVAAGINAVGNFPLALEVEDTTNLTSQDTSVIHVHPRNPIAVAIVNPNPAACGARVDFDGRQSDHPHPAINIVSYRWDLDGDGQFDDGNVAQMNLQYNQFSFGGPIRVGLEVVDTNGNTGRTNVDLRVDQGNRPPVAQPGGFRDGQGRVTGPYVIAVNDGLQLDAAGSSEPDTACGDQIVTYQWDVGNDGVFDFNGVRPAAITWAQLNQRGINAAGDFNVRLRVTDRFGVTADGIALLRVVNGPRAVGTADPDRASCNQQVRFDASRTTTDGPVDQGFAIVRYEWDFESDGIFDSNEINVLRPIAALPDANGQVRVVATLRVTDASGRQSTTQVPVAIDVQNLPPVAEAGGPYLTGRLAGGGFAPVILDGRGSLDPNAPCDAIAVYKWDTDNDGLYGADDNPDDLEGASVQYSNPNWQVNTVQIVRLIVVDRFGRASVADAANIEVGNFPPPAGQVLSPRGDDPNVCIGRNAVDVVVEVSHPDGEAMTLTVLVAGQAAGQRQVDPPDGRPVQVIIPIDPAIVPQGQQLIEVRVRTARGAEILLGAGGRITFDRTAPEIVIGNQLPEGVCQPPAAVPHPTIVVNDNFDRAPEVSEQTLEDGCGRTLRVTARDNCGNVGVADRNYPTAQVPAVQVNGVQDGQLVAEARITWQPIGPAVCVSRSNALYSLNGAAEVAYVQNTLLNQPGDYVMRINVANCLGVERDQFVRFAINRPPVAVPVTAGHPNRDANAPNGIGYVVSEGAALEVDASESTAPERIEVDRIARYDWDFRNDGTFDAEGIRVVYPTDDNDRFMARLRVTDSIGAFSERVFPVLVNDVSPVANAGGPYLVDQGSAFTPDARASRPGHPQADPIRLYTWVWDDGTPDSSGAALTQPQHTYAANGRYMVTLRVDDEDNFHEVVVVVEVRDVDPQIGGIQVPRDLVELLPMRLVADVQAGAPGDPITRYEWDMDGDGVAEYAGANISQVDHTFLEAGNHTITLTVRDADSSSIFQLPVVVREMTLAEVIAWKDAEVQRRVDGNILTVPQSFAVRNFAGQADNGLWGERNQRRGNSLMAIDQMLIGMISAHNDGANFGRHLWAMSRQLVRELTRQQAAILGAEGGPDPDADEMRRADAYIEAMEAIYARPNFERDLVNGANASHVQQLHAAAIEAYYWLTEALSPCNQLNLELDMNNPDVVSRTLEANRANDELTGVLSDQDADMTGYVMAGAGADPGPGIADVQAAIDTFDDIRELQTQDVGVDCVGREDLDCINDFDALTLELDAMSLAQELDVAGTRGVWTRNWQSCLVNTVKFRIELSISRLEFACGRFHRITQTARQKQAIGEYMVEEAGCALNAQQGAELRAAPAALQACANDAAGEPCEFRNVDGMNIEGICSAGGQGVICDPRVCSDPAALNFYRDNQQRCFLIEAYNDCLVPADATNLPIPDADIPLACLND
jgi:PKD repeat protein